MQDKTRSVLDPSFSSLLFESMADGVFTLNDKGIITSWNPAIERITGMNGELNSYSIKSVTRGKDALGEVFIQVDFEGVTYGSSAASTDVVEASAKAYLSALNIAYYAKTNREQTVKQNQRLEKKVKI